MVSPYQLAPPELVVLCDEDGHAIGTARKSTVHTTRTPLHLAFSVYLFDNDARLLVTRRAHSKRSFPGVRTNSCCGHPGPGESLPTAIQRRVHQELGVDVHDLTLVLPRFRYRAVAADGTVERELCPVYRARLHGALRPEPSEVDSAWWQDWADYAVPDPVDPLSEWSRRQVRELNELGADPWRWPTAADSELPAAAR